MTQNYRIALALTVASLMAPVAFAGYVNVTIDDPHGNKTFGNPGQNMTREDNEVEDNAVNNQSWDLETFQFDAEKSYLKLTGGFNFETGKGFGGTSLTYPQGDIFLYIGHEPYTIPGGPKDHDGPWVGSTDWNYAISFERTNGNIAVTDDGSGNKTVKYVITENKGTASYTGTVSNSLNTGLPLTANQSDPLTGSLTAQYSSNGTQTSSDYANWVNEISNIDLSHILDSIPGGETVYAYTTMACGNDVIWGQFQSVPDGGTTLVLLGSGLVGLAFLRRRIA